MNKLSKLVAGLSMVIVGLFVAQSCVQDDDYAIPPIICPEVKFNITIAELLQKVQDGTLKLNADGTIAEELIMKGIVNTSDEAGNIFKTMSFQDAVENPTAGIQIELDEGKMFNNYPFGSTVHVYLKGLVVASDRGVMKIGSKDPDFAVGRIKRAQREKVLFKSCDPVVDVVPRVVKNLKEALKPEYVNTLVTIDGVQFIEAELGKTYADKNVTVNRVLIDKQGRTVDLRNSGYATFWNDKLPTGSGKITVLVSSFTSGYQLFISNSTNVNFDQPRFTVGEGGGAEPSPDAVNLFAGADFENWTTFLGSVTSYGIKDYIKQGVGTGYQGTNSLHVLGTPKANDYVFTSFAAASIPSNPEAITFRMKGKSETKTISININATQAVTTGAAPQKYYVFNLLDVTNKDKVLEFSEGNEYRGSIDTKGEWVTVKLNIAGLKHLNLQNAEGTGFFSLKTGKDGVYDLHFDNIRIE